MFQNKDQSSQQTKYKENAALSFLLRVERQNRRALEFTHSCWSNWGSSSAKRVASWHAGVRRLAVCSKVG